MARIVESSFLLVERSMEEKVQLRSRRRSASMVVHRSKTKVVKVITTLPLRNDRESETRNRELTALREAMAELNLRSATIVTRHEDERIRSKGTVIHVVPIWRFLLSQPDSAE